MLTKPPFILPDFLFVSLHGENSPPLHLRLSLRRLTTIFSWGIVAQLLLIILSLLFFREMEKNRYLEDRLLALETESQLYQMAHATPFNATFSGTKGAALSGVSAPASLLTTTDTAQTNEPLETWAKLGFHTISCSGVACDSSINLVPSGRGLAQGGLLVVLEAEVPHIGSQINNQKRFLIYPAGTTLESFDPQSGGSYPRKTFRFSRGLQTSAHFDTGKFLNPIAVNIYLFDTKGTMVQHERKTVEFTPAE